MIFRLIVFCLYSLISIMMKMTIFEAMKNLKKLYYSH